MQLWWGPTLLAMTGWTKFTTPLQMTMGAVYLELSRVFSRITMLAAMGLPSVYFSSAAAFHVGGMDAGSKAVVGLLAGLAVGSSWWYCKQLNRLLQLYYPGTLLKAAWMVPAMLLGLELVVICWP